MINFRIRKPKPRYVKKVVNTYNAMGGRGIEIFYNLKRGKVFIAEYYQNFNNNKIRIINTTSNESRQSKITEEFVLQEADKIKQNEISSREDLKNRIKEHKRLRSNK